MNIENFRPRSKKVNIKKGDKSSYIRKIVTQKGLIFFTCKKCYHLDMSYSFVYRKRDGWWLGWVKEVPGANTQGRTREEVESNLARDAQILESLRPVVLQ